MLVLLDATPPHDVCVLRWSELHQYQKWTCRELNPVPAAGPRGDLTTVEPSQALIYTDRSGSVCSPAGLPSCLCDLSVKTRVGRAGVEPASCRRTCTTTPLDGTAFTSISGSHTSDTTCLLPRVCRRPPTHVGGRGYKHPRPVLSMCTVVVVWVSSLIGGRPTTDRNPGT